MIAFRISSTKLSKNLVLYWNIKQVICTCRSVLIQTQRLEPPCTALKHPNRKILLGRFSWMVRHLWDSGLRHRSWSQLFSIIKNSTRLEDLNELTLSPPDCLMEFCKVTLTFESVDEILWCDHSNESSLPVLSHDAICFSPLWKMKFGNFVDTCLWPHLAVKGLKPQHDRVCLE